MSEEIHPSMEDLKLIPEFEDLQPEQLEWLGERFELLTFASGDVVVGAGEPANFMAAIFEGELQARRMRDGAETVYMARKGQITAKLPFSRMKEFPSVVRAVGLTRLGRLYDEHFGEMLNRIPVLGERLVAVLADRVREVAKLDQSREKLAALGKLSAGLAHELNNPASAARRAASNLREALKQLADANRRLAGCAITNEQLDELARFEKEALGRLDQNPILDTLDRSDLEEQLIGWLERHEIPNAWEIAPVMAESGMNVDGLDTLLEMLGAETLTTSVQRASATFSVERLLRDIDSSTERISRLVKAVKEYSYMDKAQEQEIDIHRGLETTLTMLEHCTKTGVKVIRQYDKSIPKILANGGELNQVWSNLIDNAIQAMAGKGELRIRTGRELDLVLVEITDNGPGIPESIQSRIFEPFFTTKGVGDGTGLGLEFVRRIIGRHHGDVRFTSRPGETSFQVRLPVDLAPRPAVVEEDLSAVTPELVSH